MNLFKQAYKLKRDHNDEIYLGWGFAHLSDATSYYVHPNNQSYKGTTSLCQSIGEAVALFAQLLTKLTTGQGDIQGEIYTGLSKGEICLDVYIPEDWRKYAIGENIYRYRILIQDKKIILGAYDQNDQILLAQTDDLMANYMILGCFMVLLADEIDSDPEMFSLMMSYIEAPCADLFVNIHEDFYQNHKNDDYIVIYQDIMENSLENSRCFSEDYVVIKENKEALKIPVEVKLEPFSSMEFEERFHQYIPHLPQEFQLLAELSGVCMAVRNGDALSLLFHGPAGTGKTISSKLVCQSIGLPILETVNCTENLDEFVLGKYIPQEDRIVFLESYITKAIRFGGAVVFEEINFAKPQYLAFLNSLLDDNGFVRLDSGEIVKRHKNFRFFATMNLGYFGTKELNQALYNRFNAIIEIAELSDKAISTMLLARVPQCERVLEKLLGVYHKIKKYIEIEEMDLVISPRNLENWARLAKYEGYVKAAEKTLLPIAKCDRTMEETIRAMVMMYKWDK